MCFKIKKKVQQNLSSSITLYLDVDISSLLRNKYTSTSNKDVFKKNELPIIVFV